MILQDASVSWFTLPSGRRATGVQCDALAKGSALAGFLPIEGGIPWIPSVPLGQDYYGIDRSDQDYELRITYNPFARPRGYGKTDPFERAEDRAAELVVSAPGRNGKVEL